MMSTEMFDKLHKTMKEAGIERKVIVASVINSKSPKEIADQVSHVMSILCALVMDGTLIIKQPIRKEE